MDNSTILIASVLLDEVKFNKEKFIEDFSKDWGITLSGSIDETDSDIKEILSENDSGDIFISQIDGGFIIVSLMPAPIPNNEVEENAGNSFWEQAGEVAKIHQAHLLITVISDEITQTELALLFTKVVSSTLLQENAIAVYALGSVYEPQFYRETSRYCQDSQMLPILLVVYFGIYSADNGKTINGYTYGLAQFGKKEVEILNSKKPYDEVYGFLIDISNYVISYNALLQDGETIGFSEEQKLAITVSEGVALESESVKIEL